jgi:hypothetical protein
VTACDTQRQNLTSANVHKQFLRFHPATRCDR